MASLTYNSVDRSTKKLLQKRYHTDHEINLYAAYHAVHDESTVDGHFTSDNRRCLHKTATPTR